MEVIAAKVLFIEAFRKPQCHVSCQKETEQENNGGEGERVRARGLQGWGRSCALGLPLEKVKRQKKGKSKSNKQVINHRGDSCHRQLNVDVLLSCP